MNLPSSVHMKMGRLQDKSSLAAGQNQASSINQPVCFEQLPSPFLSVRLSVFPFFQIYYYFLTFYGLDNIVHCLILAESLSIPYNNNSGPKIVLQQKIHIHTHQFLVTLKRRQFKDRKLLRKIHFYIKPQHPRKHFCMIFSPKHKLKWCGSAEYVAFVYPKNNRNKKIRGCNKILQYLHFLF